MIVGLMALVVGAGAIASAYLLDMAQWHATVHYLMRRPAPLLAVAGLFLIGIGVLMTLNPQGRHGWVWRILVYAPRTAVGILVIAAGIAVIGLGAWEWLEPRHLTSSSQAAAHPRRAVLSKIGLEPDSHSGSGNTENRPPTPSPPSSPPGK